MGFFSKLFGGKKDDDMASSDMVADTAASTPETLEAETSDVPASGGMPSSEGMDSSSTMSDSEGEGKMM